MGFSVCECEVSEDRLQTRVAYKKESLKKEVFKKEEKKKKHLNMKKQRLSTECATHASHDERMGLRTTNSEESVGAELAQSSPERKEFSLNSHMGTSTRGIPEAINVGSRVELPADFRGPSSIGIVRRKWQEGETTWYTVKREIDGKVRATSQVRLLKEVVTGGPSSPVKHKRLRIKSSCSELGEIPAPQQLGSVGLKLRLTFMDPLLPNHT